MSKPQVPHSERAHSETGASGIYTWGLCAASVQAQRGVEDVTGPWAAEGTAFHEWAADCVEFGLEPEDLVGAKIKVESGWVTDEDGNPIFVDIHLPPPPDVLEQMLAEAVEDDEDPIEPTSAPATDYAFVMTEKQFGKHMRPGLAMIRELAAPDSAKLFVETRVDISRWNLPGTFSTLDVGIVDLAAGEITGFDWKFGRGVPVVAEDCWQVWLYALGLWDAYAEAAFAAIGLGPEDVDVRIVIEQPRHHAGGGVAYPGTMADLLVWGEWARERAEATREAIPVYTPGEKQCRWCRARRSCGAFSAYLLETARLKFEDLDDALALDYEPALPRWHHLTVEERVFIHRNAPLFKTWLDEIHQSLMQEAVRGDPTPGLKLVAGRKGKRSYDPEETAAVNAFLREKLGDEAFVLKPITPAQAEEKLSAEDFETLSTYVRQSTSKPALVDERSPKPALPRLVDKFDDLTTQEDK